MAVYLVGLGSGFEGDPVAHGGELIDVAANPSLGVCGGGVVANVTLRGSAGSLVVCFAFRGLCLCCGSSTPEDRPIWLKRSVASPLLGYADRPVRATHDGGRHVP